MSETQHYRGKLTIASNPNESVEDAAKRIMLSKGMKAEDYYNDWTDALESEFYKEYVVINGIIYYAEKESIDPCDSFFIGRKTDDPNTIEFDVMYYDGGCSFAEAMEAALKDAAEKL